MPRAELVDRKPFAYTMLCATDPEVPSDHVPVCAKIVSPARCTGFRSMARWIPSHDNYAEFVESILQDVELHDDPFSRLETIAEVLHEAGHRVRKQSAKVRASTTHHRLYWMLPAMRAART
eukprot:8208823-Heterocapsa_arctica.AAC.1